MSRYILALLCIAVPLSGAHAAPMDSFLEARARPGLEIGYDYMDENFDIFGFSDDYGVDETKYDGWHIGGTLGLTQRLSVDATWWRREVSVGNFAADLDSWQLAAQYLLVDGGEKGISLAVRAGAWANETDKVEKNYNLGLAGTQTSFIRVDEPTDQQQQLDVVLNLPLTAQSRFSGFVSVGNSEVDFDDISGTGTYNSCLYDLEFGANEYIGTLAAPCSADTVVTSFSKAYDSNDVNVYREMRYESVFYQAGFNLTWQSQQWRLKGGYTFFYIKRDDVDDAIDNRGDDSYQGNHTLLGQVAYRLSGNIWTHITAQYMHNQFNSEIPLAYNSATAKHFDKRYGLLTMAVRITL